MQIPTERLTIEFGAETAAQTCTILSISSNLDFSISSAISWRINESHSLIHSKMVNIRLLLLVSLLMVLSSGDDFKCDANALTNSFSSIAPSCFTANPVHPSCYGQLFPAFDDATWGDMCSCEETIRTVEPTATHLFLRCIGGGQADPAYENCEWAAPGLDVQQSTSCNNHGEESEESDSGEEGGDGGDGGTDGDGGDDGDGGKGNEDDSEEEEEPEPETKDAKESEQDHFTCSETYLTENLSPLPNKCFRKAPISETCQDQLEAVFNDATWEDVCKCRLTIKDVEPRARHFFKRCKRGRKVVQSDYKDCEWKPPGLDELQEVPCDGDRRLSEHYLRGETQGNF
jgi:hypothetical protein